MYFPILMLSLVFAYFTLMLSFVLKELKAITKAITSNPQLAANAESTQNLANILTHYIEKRYYSVGGGD